MDRSLHLSGIDCGLPHALSAAVEWILRHIDSNRGSASDMTTPEDYPEQNDSSEHARLQTLNSYEVLDSPPEQIFDDLARLAASIAGTPIALVSLVDGKRQWFKAKIGLDAPETPRDVAFCAHAIRWPDVFVVPDATRDERFSTNPLVMGGPKIRFYAGAPLITHDGHALGTLCVIDTIPRNFSGSEREALRELAQQVMGQLELRRRASQFIRNNPSRQHTIASIRKAIDSSEFFDGAHRLHDPSSLSRRRSLRGR